MQLVHLVLPLMFAVACYTEIRWRQIPNWLTIAGMGFGLGSAFIEGDGSGLLSASIGLAVGGGIFLPFCLMGVLGGGDMKLMAAVGAMVGWPLI
ncbi:MAG: A24 family peptidase, partial [Kiritimatiellia bacterium]